MSIQVPNLHTSNSTKASSNADVFVLARKDVTAYLDVGSFGGYHGTCDDSALHLATFAGTDGDLVRFVFVAELAECFMAAKGSWNCGFSSGEGLSRIMATERYPASLGKYASAPTWLDGSRPDSLRHVWPRRGRTAVGERPTLSASL